MPEFCWVLLGASMNSAGILLRFCGTLLIFCWGSARILLALCWDSERIGGHLGSSEGDLGPSGCHVGSSGGHLGSARKVSSFRSFTIWGHKCSNKLKAFEGRCHQVVIYAAICKIKRAAAATCRDPGRTSWACLCTTTRTRQCGTLLENTITDTSHLFRMMFIFSTPEFTGFIHIYICIYHSGCDSYNWYYDEIWLGRPQSP